MTKIIYGSKMLMVAKIPDHTVNQYCYEVCELHFESVINIFVYYCSMVALNEFASVKNSLPALITRPNTIL